MNITKYDPFRDFRFLHNEINRLFADVNPNTGRTEMVQGSWFPNVDIYEDKDRLILEADLPGLTRENFELSVENNVLTLRGERKLESTTNGENYHRVERSYGAFSRQFSLPPTITAEGATADFENGVLRVSLAKREETKARKIEVGGVDAGQEKAIGTSSSS